MAAGVRRLFSNIPCRDVRFRSLCTLWELAVRGFRPAFFPWLAVIPSNRDLNQEELSFICHAGNDCIYKRPTPCGNIVFDKSYVSSNKDGWMMFVRHDFVRNDFCVPIIVNPVTGAQLQHLPSLDTLVKRHRWNHIDFGVFLADNLVAFAECCVDEGYEGYHILAAATPGDDEWSFIHLSSSFLTNTIRSIVFHEADRRFYYMDRQGQMQSFRLTRCGRKTVFGEVSSILADATRRETLLFDSHLVSDGTNLLLVRKRKPNSFYCFLIREKQGSSHLTSTKFEILKYCPDADMWIEMTNMDYLGNNSLFFDSYGARLLPLPQEEEEEVEGRPRRNCIYFTDRDEIENDQYVHYVRVYDVGKGTVEPCFSTNIQSDNHRPAHMWFTPSLCVKN